ncbi:MAG: hypothetical protein ABIK86_07325 [candidate division WOR-3 bacterium]
MKRNHRLFLVAVLLTGALAAVGCGGAKEKPAAPKAAEVDISALPEFLRYPGAQATERIDINTGEKKGAVWTLLTADAPAQVIEWYSASAAKAGWITLPKKPNDMTQMLEFDSPDKTQSVKIVLYPKDGKTAISLAHGIKSDSGS